MKAHMATILVALFALAAATSAAAQATNTTRTPFPQPPWNIAHRGDAGELPEHTLQAYRQGIQEGADWIECDMSLTMDCQIVCRHEPDVNGTTDAYTKFRTLYGPYQLDINNRGVGILTTQMTLAQIKTLQAQTRIETRGFRNPNYDLGGFQIPTLQEYLDVIKSVPDRVVGAIPETKHPLYFDTVLATNSSFCARNRTFSQIVLEILTANGIGGAQGSTQWNAQPIAIQSFEINNLKELHAKTNIPLVQLLDAGTTRLPDNPNITYANMVTDQGLADIAKYAQILGPSKGYYSPTNASTGNATAPGYVRSPNATVGERTDLLAAALKNGLIAGPYTYRMENQFLSWDFQQDGYLEFEYTYNDLNLTGGVFSDFPQSLTNYLRCAATAKAAGLPGPGIVPPRPANPNFPQITFKNRTAAQSIIGYPRDRLPTDRPWIIAAGGASGVLPDSTVQAFQYAVDQGANLIACNVTVTADNQLICANDINLAPTTDAPLKFANQVQNTIVNNATVASVASSDLTLAQVQTLRANQLYRSNVPSFRDPNYNGLFAPATFAQFLSVARNASYPVGVYVNILAPTAQNAALSAKASTSTVEDLVLAALASAGYTGGVCRGTWNRYPVMIASVESTSLKKIKARTDIPLVQIISQVAPDTGMTWRQVTTDVGLDAIAAYAAAISPNKEFLVPALTTIDRTIRPSTGLTGRIQQRGMLVFPYKFQNENVFLSWSWGQDAHRELDYFLTTEGVDGGITDFPGTMNAVIQCKLREPKPAFAIAGPASAAHALCFPSTLSGSAAAPGVAAAGRRMLGVQMHPPSED